MATIGFEWNQADDIVNHLKLESYKTLILSKNEYKKYDEGSPAVKGDSNAIPKMTSNNTPSGIASASSEQPNFEAWKAFDDDDEHGNAWLTTNGSLTGWIKYDFGVGVKKYISSYKIKSQISTSTTDFSQKSPKDWSFEGSNDGVNWIVLDKRVGVTDWTKDNYKHFDVEQTGLYQMFRLNVTANNGDVSFIGVGEFQMIEGIPATPPSWKTVSTTLPSTEQFQEEGMEDLTVFDRKMQSPIDSPINMTNDTLGEGKVFKGRVDLKKIVDLRKLEVK